MIGRVLLLIVFTLIAAPAHAERLFLSDGGGRAAAPLGVRVDAAVARDLATNRRAVALTDVPLAAGGSASFDLQPLDVFAPGAEVVEFDGTHARSVGRPDVAVYEGKDSANPSRTIVVAISAGTRVVATVRDGQQVVSLVRPLDDGGHTLVDPAQASPAIARDVCENHVPAPGLPRAPAARAAVTAELPPPSDYPPGPTLALEVLFDVGNDLYVNQFDSNTTEASSYVTALVGAISGTFRRDVNIAILIEQIVVWTTPDPFGGPDTGAQLTAYKAWNEANRVGVPRDAAHLLADLDGAGGRAYLDVLCNDTFHYGVSNLDGYYSTFPTIGDNWDVSVVAHELGHNFGSPHTHCYVPPLDHCYNDEAGCYAGPVEPSVGETMSYCHLVDTIDMGFRPTVTALIRAHAEAKTGGGPGLCVGNAPGTCGDGVLDEGENCDDGNVLDGDCCASNCAAESGQPCTDDGDPCTTDACGEAGVCTHTPPGTCLPCDAPILVPPAGGFFQGATAATSTVTSSCGGSGPEVAFSWTPASDGIALISTCGSEFDTVLHARTGTCAGGPEVTCNNDDASCFVGSRLNFAVVAGTTYYVFVDGFGGSLGNYSVSFDLLTLPVCNAAPLPGCKLPAPGKAAFQLKKHASDDTKDQLQWKWGNGAVTSMTDLGHPDTTDFYQLCAYGNGTLVMDGTVTPGGTCAGGKPCWKAKPTSFAFKDKSRAPDGIEQLQLSSSLVPGKSKIGLKGKGSLLHMPPSLLGVAAPIRVQLVRPGGPCWEAVYSAPVVKPDGSQLKAKSD